MSIAIAVVALLLPAWPAGEDMGSTHYMGLLAANQPWNLLLFMAVPVVLAETIAVTELAILFRRTVHPAVRGLNRYAGLVAGFYFLGGARLGRQPPDAGRRPHGRAHPLSASRRPSSTVGHL